MGIFADEPTGRKGGQQKETAERLVWLRGLGKSKFHHVWFGIKGRWHSLREHGWLYPKGLKTYGSSSSIGMTFNRVHNNSIRLMYFGVTASWNKKETELLDIIYLYRNIDTIQKNNFIIFVNFEVLYFNIIMCPEQYIFTIIQCISFVTTSERTIKRIIHTHLQYWQYSPVVQSWQLSQISTPWVQVEWLLQPQLVPQSAPIQPRSHLHEYCGAPTQ